MANATQISIAFFADIAGEEDSAAQSHAASLAYRFQRRPCRQQASESRSVIACARGLEAAAAPLRADRRTGREDRVDMRGNQDAAIILLQAARFRRAEPERVPAGVDLHALQAKLAETLAQPRCARALLERRRRNFNQIGLPIHDAAFLKMQPLEGLMDRALAGEINHPRKSRRSGKVWHESLRVALTTRLVPRITILRPVE